MTSANAGGVAIPDGFILGTATAAYQVEGSVNVGGRGDSIWDTFSRTPGNVRNGDTGDIACDHYRRLGEDLSLIAELGADAYRFSVAWPRVQPEGKGPASSEGLDFYRRLVDGLRERGILPVPTLYHWDLPQPLQDVGGWPARDTANRFADYAAIVAAALGQEVGQWITMNEPWCAAWFGYGTGLHAPGLRDIGLAVAATHHLLLGHGEAVKAIRSVLPATQVGISLNPGVFRPASDHEDDVAAVRRAEGNQNRLLLDPLFAGRYPLDMLEHYAGRAPGFAVVRDGDLDVISTPVDFLGLNYYGPNTVASESRTAAARTAGYIVSPGDRDPISADLRIIYAGRPGIRRTEMGWEVEAGGLTELLTRVASEYAPMPILITENGAACADYVAPDGVVRDPERIRYIDEHLRAALRASECGADVRGYFVWGLLDNFEWAEGYSRRFGLVWVDYPTGKRIPKQSFRWYRDVAMTRSLGSPPTFS